MGNITKLLFLLLITIDVAYATVIAKVDYKTVELGEMVTYSLNVSGENITRPNIKRLCYADLISTSSQTNVQIVNGNVIKSYILNYKFIPQKSCKIEPIEVEINGKTELSNEVEIKVSPVAAAKDLDFVLTLESEKKELFVGETFDIALTFKQKTDAEAVDSEFTPPEIKGFWIKNESKPKRYEDGKYTITKIIYTIAPQRVGELKISKAQMRVASRDKRTSGWGDWIPTIKWKTYFSNELSFDIKPLPLDVNLIGNFTIKATTDKTNIKANEVINVTVEVQGNGNLEDIKSFKPNINSVTVFDEKIAIDGAKLTQKIAFVADRDFVIPSFALKYFDSKTKEIKNIFTEEIKIDVINEKTEDLIVKKSSIANDVEIKSSNSDEYNSLNYFLFFLFGLAFGILAMFFREKIKVKNSKKEDLINNPRVLLMKLLPFKDDLEVKEMIEILEKNIYSNQDIKLDKKALKKLKKTYKIY